MDIARSESMITKKIKVDTLTVTKMERYSSSSYHIEAASPGSSEERIEIILLAREYGRMEV